MINQIIKDWVGEEIQKLEYPEGTDYVAVKALQDLIPRIPQLTERIEKEMEVKISQLRQWLNEDRIDNPKKMITNEDIKYWLEITNTLKGGKE